MLEKLINKVPVIALDEASIDEVIKYMVKKNVSSALIKDKSDKIVGIVTERDVLRNLSTLDVDRKLSRPIRVVMNRPVKFVRYEHLKEDITKLSEENSVRHFPVILNEDDNSVDNLVGMITATDFFKYSLESCF